MAKSRRGGYRKPTANTSNVVSGPGALSQRTDGNASAPAAASGGDYGQRKAIEAQVSASGGLPKAKKMPSFDIAAPTNFPQQPPTSGGAIGPGNPPKQNLYNDVDVLLYAAAELTKNPIFYEMINTRAAQR